MSLDAQSSRSFRQSLNDRVKRLARERGVLEQELHRQFLVQRLLARVFASDSAAWVLKGGAGLAVRLPRARLSQDIDLSHPGSDIDGALAGMRRLMDVEAGDPLRFVMGDPRHMAGATPGWSISVEAFIGATSFRRFPLDVSMRQTALGVQRIRPGHVVDLPGLPDLPEFVLCSIAEQVADKVCALYERHGSLATPSTRYRDLVDLVLIVQDQPLDAAEALRAMTSEFERRQLRQPASIVAPGPTWLDGYRQEARRFRGAALPSDLTDALMVVGMCLTPLLAGQVTVGTWNPTAMSWEREG